VAADSKAKLLNEAEKYMLHGKIPQAIGEYQKIVHNDPEDILTLNTIGDLYLTIGKTAEANNCFIRVADSYVRNNFFLKAIAVYKKILKADPDSLEINATIASLYAKQGLNMDACSQYLRLVTLYEKSGDTQYIVDTYKKIVELDPANAVVHQKLAGVFLAGDEDEKGRLHLLSAARALVKAKNHAAALTCFEQAVQIDPSDINGLKGLMECCLKTGNLQTILDRLKESLTLNPDNPAIKEMLGQVHLAGNDPETARDILNTVVAADESCYKSFLPVAQAFIDMEKYDRAAECLDPIIPILISRHETGLAVNHYQQVLERSSAHIPTMEKLAFVYSAAGDIPLYLELLDKIADHHVDQGNQAAALEWLGKILQADPESKKHLDLHKAVFLEANPEVPYVSPVTPAEVRPETGQIHELSKDADEPGDAPETIVEADLLINYGMREKALGLLKNLEAADRNDKKVRTRLFTLYKEEKKYTEAAEQCLLLAALYGKSNDDESVEKYLSEAKQLDPDLVDREQDLDLFARKRGVVTDFPSGSGNPLESDPEVDLSGDLLDIFFTGKENDPHESGSDIPIMPSEIPDGFSQEIPSAPPTQSIEEKLQEVDFYIRLGFNDEALNKLNEIAKISPDNPELPSRYEKLNELEAAGEQDSEKTAAGRHQSPEASSEAAAGDIDLSRDADIDAALINFGKSAEEASDLQDDAIELEMPEDADAALEAVSGGNIKLPESLRRPASPADSSDFAFLEQPDDAIEIEMPDDTDTVPEFASEEIARRPEFPKGTAPTSDSSDFIENDMFSDLLEEVSTLSEREIAKESYEDHFSLGTAYRDMDLIDEAIKEFQTALRITESNKDSRKLIQCCGMLSTCFLKKSMPRSALRWCQMGLNVKGIAPQEAMALRYDMGLSHLMEGNRELALQCFDLIFSTDPGYRDVAQKIDEIKSGRT
jgi:tetratricopeptide (TPR) repeat protein